MPELQPFSFDRVVRAVERVRQRLLQATAALENTGIPYAVIGDNAVAYWVSQIDQAAVRNTPAVELLVRRVDRQNVWKTFEAAGFAHLETKGMDLFLENSVDSTRHAVRIVFSGECVRPDDLLPAPDMADSEQTSDYCVLSLNALVLMELTAFRRVNRVNLRDMIDVGLVDSTWPSRFPSPLDERLQELLDDPDG